jgi:hypothetical protein
VIGNPYSVALSNSATSSCPSPTLQMPTATKQVREEFLSSLHDTLASIFQGAQTSNASHKRRIKTLCKLHAEAASHVEHKPGRKGDDGSILLVGEKAFNRAFWQVVLCVLDVKRGVVEADRVVRLIGGFVTALMEQQGIFFMCLLIYQDIDIPCDCRRETG